MSDIVSDPSLIQERPAAPAYPPQNVLLYLEMSVYWFALSFLWSGMITIVIQTLVKQFVGDQKDLYLGWTLGSGAFVSTIVCMVVGALSDQSRWRMGKRRPYIIVGTLLAAPALVWMAYVHSIAALVVDFCLIQFWVNVATSPYQALVPDLVPKAKQGAASAYMGMGSLLGQLGGLILCGMLIARPGGLQIVMITLTVLLVASMAYTAWRIPERTAVNNPAPRTGIVQTVIHSFQFNIRESPDFFWLIASRFVINMGFYSATEFLLYYVEDTLHAPNPTGFITQVFVLSTISGLLGNFPAGMLSDKYPKKNVVYVSAAISGVAALVFLLTSSLQVALFGAFLFGMGLGAFSAVDWALATNLLPDHDEAKHMGIWHVAFTVPQVVAPLVGGLVAYFFNQHFGHGLGYRAVLFSVMIYLFLGTLLLHPIKEHAINKKSGEAATGE